MKRNNMKKRLCMALCALFSAQSKNADAGYRYNFGEHLYKIVARKDDELTDLEKKIEKGPVPLTEFYDEKGDSDIPKGKDMKEGDKNAVYKIELNPMKKQGYRDIVTENNKNSLVDLRKYFEYARHPVFFKFLNSILHAKTSKKESRESIIDDLTKTLDMYYRISTVFDRILKLSGGLAAITVAATVGGVAAVQWRKFRSRVAEDRRKDDLLHERKIKAQKDYDQKMKDMLGHSSIDYTKKWRLIENNINNLKAQSPHNESAINAFIDHIRGFYLSNQENGKGECMLLSPHGTPGCGKTSFCLKLAKELGAENPVIIGPADFDLEHKTLSVNQQIRGTWWEGSEERGYLAYGKLVGALKHNKHPIIIIDELDKLPKGVLSVLWDAADTGRINVAGEDIICDGAIFLLPCNFSLIDPENYPNDKAMVGKSLASRITDIEFKTPIKESYRIAFNKELKNIAASTKKEYEINLEYDKEFIDLLSQKCVEKDDGYRSVSFYKRLIKSAIELKYQEISKLGETDNISKFKLDFDKDKKDTIICNLID